MTRTLSVIATAALSLGGLLSAQNTLTTTFTSDNGGNAGGAVHFDMQVTASSGVVITRLDVNVANPQTTPGVIEFYTTNLGGTHIGNQVNPPSGMWLLRATANVTAAGSGTATVGILNKPVVLLPGTYGVTIGYKRIAARYTGTAAAPPTQTVFANGDITLTLGTAQNVLFSSAPFTPRVANLTFHYGLLNADQVDFTADVIAGTGPLLVNFADRSFMTAPIAGWQWDFDNDNVVDSTAQNPTTVYPTCGTWSPRLRVLRSNGPPLDLVWTSLIEVDPLTADFTATPDTGAPPLPTQFTDTSTGTPQTWAWDFNDDGLTDSTVQNPLNPFLAGCHKVTLTVTRNCRTATVSRRITAVPTTFTTTFNAGTYLTARQGIVFFDLNVLATEHLSVCGIDVNALTPPGHPCGIEVWLTDTTWVGKHLNAAVWRKVASGSALCAGGNVATRIMLDRPILLQAGRSYGIGVNHLDTNPYYLNPGAVIANADLSMTPGGVAGSATLFGGGVNMPRQWVGSLHYLKELSLPQGAVTWMGSGCPGPLGIPHLEPQGSSRPRTGTTTTLRVTNMPINAGIMMLGLSSTSSLFGPLPLDLTFLGMPGCTAFTSPDATTFLLGAGNVASFNLVLPANQTLAGIRFFNQGLVLSPGTNGFGAVVSDATAGLTGNF